MRLRETMKKKIEEIRIHFSLSLRLRDSRFYLSFSLFFPSFSLSALLL